jgi:endonuclease/exonuclease/phosphatase family metal-dependent hydrolase
MSGASFTVLTLNLHKGFGFWNRRFVLPELREAVRALHADVVLLQEVLGGHELHALRVKGWPAVAYGRNAVYPDGHHGNAVLSKFPIVAHRNHDVSVGTREPRGLLHCRLDLPGRGEVHAICAHLALHEAERRAQLDLLCDIVRREVPPAAPLVVAGDFNDWRRRAGPVLARCGLHDVFVEALGRPARTFPARWPLLALDRIYVRDARAQRPAVHSVRPWSHLSDHVPLSVEVSL